MFSSVRERALGDWTVFRLAAPHDAESDLSLDRAFGLMLNLAGFT